MQEKGKVTFALNGERLVGSEDVVPLSSRADLLEGSSAISWATLAPRTPGLADTAAAELAGEARGQRVLALVLRAHQAETQALFLWLVCNALRAGGTQAMARWADAAIGARIVEAVTMATHARHCALIDVLAVGAVESLVALRAVSAHLTTYRPWLLHPCVLQLGALVALALAPGGTDAPTTVLLLGEAREWIAATRLLGQCVLETAAQRLLGGWPGVLGLGVL